MESIPRRRGSAFAGGVVVAGLFASCAPDFDTTRRAAPIGTVGSEVFNVMCERLHTGESPRDVTFERGRAPCTQGLSATASAPQGVGPKTVALSRMRADVVSALDTAMPRDTYTPLDRLLVGLLPLYGTDGSGRTDAMRRPGVLTSDGGVATAEDLLPQTTRAASSLVNRMAGDQDALLALERMSLRQGYRPARVAFGLLRPVLAYDRVDGLLDTTFRMFRDATLVAPAGTANAQFNATLAMLRGEFADARPATAEESVAGTTLDAVLSLMLRTDDALATGQPIEVVRRNACGFAQLDGPIAAPFVDTDMNGVVDTVRCAPVDAQRQPIRNAPTPFPAHGAAETPRDAAGRATVTAGGPLRYRYVNLDTSMLGAVSRQLPPLLTGVDTRALQLVHGAQGLFGDRAMASRMYSSGALSYRQFNAQGSPLVDLVHGLGVFLTHKDAPAMLTMARQLMTGQNEAKLARVMGALLRAKEISDRYTDVSMEARSVIWDDVMGVVQRVAAEPGLLEDVLEAVASSTTRLPATGLWESSCAGTVPLENVARSFGGYMTHRDRVEPDWNTTSQVNGLPGWNAHVVNPLTRNVDRAMPDTQSWQSPGTAADNRSTQGRLFHLVDDLTGARMCNKNHAAVRVRFNVPLLGEQSIGVPGATDIPACELVEVPDSAVFYLRTVVGGRRGILPLSIPGLAGTITDIARRFGVSLDSTLDGLVQSQSQIAGFNSEPSPYAVARLVFNPRPNAFLRDLMDPVLIRNADGIDPAAHPEYVVRNYHRATLFAWEGYCFYDSVRPLAAAFVRHDRIHVDSNPAHDIVDPQLASGANPATMAPRVIDSSKGARLFVDLFDAFHHHWQTARSGDFQSSTRCDTCSTGRNFGYNDGASRYEQMLGEIMASDLLPALGDLTVALRTINPTAGNACLDRARPGMRRACTGIDVTASLVRALVSPNPTALDGTPAFAAAPSNRSGVARALWSDGTTPTDATVYTLFADAFNAMDPLIDRDPTQRANWNAARSATVDQLLAVDGTGVGAQFHNRSIAPITRMTTDWAVERLAAHRTAGDLDRWARDGSAGLAARLSSVVQGPAFSSAIDMSLALYNDRDARSTMGAFVTWLLSTSTVGDASRTGSNFATTVSALADLLQVARADQDIDPFLHTFAPAMQPVTGTVPLGLRFLDRARGYDPDRVLTRVLANMTRRPTGADALALEPLSVVADAIADTHRQTPGDHGPMAALDFRAVLLNVAEFFSDDRRGLEQFYAIVQHRRLPQ